MDKRTIPETDKKNLYDALSLAQCPVWVHNAAHTNDIEKLRAIALWYANWNNEIRVPALYKPVFPNHA